MRQFWLKLKRFLQTLSFRTGVISLMACGVFYVASFCILPLSISPVLRTALWVLFFGLAKSAQYAGLAILGKEGILRLKRAFKRHRK